MVEDLKHEAAQCMKVKAVWQFFEAEREANAIHLFEAGAQTPLHTFRFGRQRRDEGLCLSDYILDPVEGARDHIEVFVVTAGGGLRRKPEGVKEAGPAV